MSGSHEVVIVGGGFGGLYAALHLRRARANVTVIDRRNYHLFQPLLYQVATGGLSPAEIASPLRGILNRQQNTRVLLAEAVDVEVDRRRVILCDGEVPYDTLLVATGARHHYFGHEAWEALAPGLKTIEDATEMRARILIAFERAERERDPELRRALLTFVIVGGGPTGVELAGAMGEIANDTLRHDFRAIDPADAVILLLEGLDRVLPTYPPALSEKAARSLARLGVRVETRTRVTAIEPGAVTVQRPEVQKSDRIPTGTILWAAGVQASSLGAKIARRTGAALDRAGRLQVEPDLTLAGHPEIFVIGDLASFTHQGSEPLPGVAPVAMQQGRYVAKTILDRLEGKAEARPFRYRDRGSMATIGRAAAVADLGRLEFSGYLAWLLWLFVHVAFLIEFKNRVLVLFQWAWSYATRNRSARLITGHPPPLPPEAAECEPLSAAGEIPAREQPSFSESASNARKTSGG